MRCFIAIEMPADVQHRLAKIQDALSAVTGVKWARAEQIHLTLKFLGEISDTQLPAVCQAVRNVAARFKPMDLDVAGLGCFPRRGPARVAWVGVREPPDALIECQQALEHALDELGFAPENRPFHPHLTIGRAKAPQTGRELRRQIESYGPFDAGPCPAEELIVFQSVLQRTGPTYTPLARCALSQP